MPPRFSVCPYIIMPWDGDNDTLCKDARKIIRKESNNAYNRLHSISEDAEFVARINRFYTNFKIYPNLRCGAWYVDPAVADRNPVYFKSTDGHFNHWAFNLRRLNLHLIQSIIDVEGIIIVDSTRQGKRLPDALSKTIPIWCAVINLAVLKSSNTQSNGSTSAEWGLHTPTGSVTRSEHSQIESRLECWAQLLLNSEFTVPSIHKPLRPIWITPETEILPSLDSRKYYPVVCVSASKLVPEGLDRRTAGYTYVQGSGDDHETWSAGLTPDIFWEHKERLLACPPEDLMDQIHTLVSTNNGRSHSEMIFPIKAVQSRISVGMIPPTYSFTSGISHILITCLPSLATLDPNKLLHLELMPNKKGQMQFVTETLPQSMIYLKTKLSCNQNVVILCRDGKDLSVGVALAALTLFFDTNGMYIPENSKIEPPTKSVIQKRLQWILADNPYANPARNTLKRVNEYLMSQPRRINAAAAAIE